MLSPSHTVEAIVWRRERKYFSPDIRTYMCTRYSVRPERQIGRAIFFGAPCTLLLTVLVLMCCQRNCVVVVFVKLAVENMYEDENRHFVQLFWVDMHYGTWTIRSRTFHFGSKFG